MRVAPLLAHSVIVLAAVAVVGTDRWSTAAEVPPELPRQKWETEFPPSNLPAVPLSDPDAYSVFDAAMRIAGVPIVTPHQAVVLDSTSWHDDGIPAPASTDRVWSEAANASDTANAISYAIREIKPFGLSVPVVSAAIFRDASVSPHFGIVRFHAPGFNAGRTWAVLKMVFNCRDGCGASGWLAFEMIDGRWRRAFPGGWSGVWRMW